MISPTPSDPLAFPETTASVVTLPNGLEVIIDEDHSAPVVSLQAWCRAGSIHEGSWLGAGMSHFLEHMLFKGTERRSATGVAREVQSNGGYINAYTSFDRTVYWIDCPTAGFDACLDILCDVIGSARLPEEEFEREQEVIRREFAMGDDSPQQVLSKMLFHNAYTVHPCRHPVIGHLDLFNQLSRDDLYTYYLEQYSPEQVFFVVAGDVDTEEVASKIDSLLGGLTRRRREQPVLPEEPNYLGCRGAVEIFPTELARSRVAWQIPDTYHPDVPALDLLAAVLGNGRSSRLYQSIREEKQLAHAVSTFAFSPSFRGVFVLGVESETDRLDAAEEAAFTEIDRLVGEGISEEEHERVLNQALSSQFSTMLDMRGRASDLASNWLTARNLDYTRDYVTELQGLTPDDVRRVARVYLKPDRWTRVALKPKTTVASIARPGASRSEDIRRVQLDNGLTVLLLADRRVPFVQATGAFRGGRLAETGSNNGITKLMSRLLTKDTAKRSAREISEAIESAGGGISASLGNNTFGTSVGALCTHLELVVDLLGESLIHPLFLEDAVAMEKHFQQSAIKSDADHPFTVALQRLRAELYGDHPYGLPEKGTDKSLASLDQSAILDFRARLVSGSNGVVGVFGDLDLDRAEDLVRGRFAALPEGTPEFTGPSGTVPPDPGGRTVEEFHEKEQAILLIGYPTCSLYDDDNYPVGLIDEACSDMASRMFIRIREELGLAYSVGCMRMLGIDPGYLAFYAATSPEKLDLVQEEMIAEIAKLSREGLEKEEFERAKASWMGREVIHLQGARELAGVATVDELVGLGWDHYRKAPGLIDGLTEQRVSEVAEKYLRDENRIIVRLTTPSANASS